jgi:hypothetical protein
LGGGWSRKEEGREGGEREEGEGGFVVVREREETVQEVKRGKGKNCVRGVDGKDKTSVER